MKNTWKIVAAFVMAMAFTACNNGGGGGGSNNSNPTAANGFLATNGNRGYMNPGTYTGVVTVSSDRINTSQYNYLMTMLNMEIVSMNFKMEISTNGQIPGNANFYIVPMHQNRYYQRETPGLNDQGETASYGVNGMILTYYLPDNSKACANPGACNMNNPDIQIVASVTQAAPNQPTSCGGGWGYRQALNVQLRVAGVILGSGTLCSNGGGGGGAPGYNYNPGFNNANYYQNPNYNQQQQWYRPNYYPQWR